jgi:hypothetical protein
MHDREFHLSNSATSNNTERLAVQFHSGERFPVRSDDDCELLVIGCVMSLS